MSRVDGKIARTGGGVPAIGMAATLRIDEPS